MIALYAIVSSCLLCATPLDRVHKLKTSLSTEQAKKLRPHHILEMISEKVLLPEFSIKRTSSVGMIYRQPFTLPSLPPGFLVKELVAFTKKRGGGLSTGACARLASMFFRATPECLSPGSEERFTPATGTLDVNYSLTSGAQFEFVGPLTLFLRATYVQSP